MTSDSRGLPLTTGEGNTAAVCTCTEDESSDGSASYEDNPHCPVHGWCSWQAECGRLRERIVLCEAALKAEMERANRAETRLRSWGADDG